MTNPSDSYTEEELKEIETQVTKLAIEIEGRVFLVQKDKDGNPLLKDEIPNETAVAMYEKTITDVIRYVAKEDEIAKKFCRGGCQCAGESEE